MTYNLDKQILENQLGEPVYPIYSFNFRWIQDGVQDLKYPAWHEGLPEGRIYNSTGFNKMFKTDQTQESIDLYARNWWNNYISSEKNKSKNIDPAPLKLEGKFIEYETWYLTWFQHETFDFGQTDSEAVNSFSRFVDRKEAINEISQREKGEDKYCLMGAEDRWRWRTGSEECESIPCRCRYCNELGVLRISH